MVISIRNKKVIFIRDFDGVRSELLVIILNTDPCIIDIKNLLTSKKSVSKNRVPNKAQR